MFGFQGRRKEWTNVRGKNVVKTSAACRRLSTKLFWNFVDNVTPQASHPLSVTLSLAEDEQLSEYAESKPYMQTSTQHWLGSSSGGEFRYPLYHNKIYSFSNVLNALLFWKALMCAKIVTLLIRSGVYQVPPTTNKQPKQNQAELWSDKVSHIWDALLLLAHPNFLVMLFLSLSLSLQHTK